MSGSINRRESASFNRQLLASPPIYLAALAMLLLLFISAFSLSRIRATQEHHLNEHLLASLNSTTKLVSFWYEQNLSMLQVLINTQRGREALVGALKRGQMSDQERAEFREWLYPIMRPLMFDGYSIISLNQVLIDASSEAYIGHKVAIPETKVALAKAARGHPAMSLPTASKFVMNGPRGDQPIGTMMQNLCTAIDEGAQLLGYLCVRFNSSSSFFPLLTSGRFGATGEIYAINAEGKILSPSRFFPEPRLVDGPRGPEWLQTPLEARVPGEDKEHLGPLTRIAEQLIHQGGDWQQIGYRDYRGRLVAGVGRWLPEMDMGLILEQDLAEAFESYYVARSLVIGLSASAMGLILLLTLSALSNRRRLAIREGRFRSLLSHIPVPVLMCDLEGRIQVVNSAFCELVKLDLVDLVGSYLHQLPLPRWLAPLGAELTFDGDSVGLSESRLSLTPVDGSTRHFYLLRFPVIYVQGEAHQAWAWAILDETDRVEAAYQQSNMNQRLERLVEERTSELNRAKEEALAASRAKAEFLANMSHEIRTPLNAIIGLAHVATAKEKDEQQRNYLQKMRASGEHLLEVINDILSFSRLEAGKLKPDQLEFVLEDVLDRAVSMIWDKADAKGLNVHVHITPDIPSRLIGDPLRLGQILINLLANAVKFTDKGGVDLRVLLVDTDGKNIRLLFEVEDTGIGIAPELVKTLFQPFHQVDNSSTRRFEGTGLGLAICKSLAELMGAQLEVSSYLGQGSCFRLFISLEIAALGSQISGRSWQLDSASRAPAQAVTDFALGAKILVVEDNPLNQEIIASLLETWGCEVDLAETGLEALDVLRDGFPQLVLMDIQLPGMDGVETTAKIRQLRGGKELPVVAVTANALPGDREKYLASGMDDYIAKPIDPALLKQLLTRWLNPGYRQASTAAVANHQDLEAEISFEALQQAGIDTEKALYNLMNNRRLYCNLLQRFAEERAEFPAQLAELLESGNQGEALNQVHSLKSLSASLGMLDLEARAAELEAQLRDNKPQQDLVDELGGQLRQVITILKAWFYQFD